MSTANIREEDLRKLRVNKNRLMGELHRTCSWGTGKRWGSESTETGMSRLSLSDADKQARDWFVRETTALGCTVTVDAMGNIFAVRPGRRSQEPPICAGSHLDTQPNGGRYDGILGVHAGVEMLRVLNDHDVETEHPIGVVNWTNEEGARFPISMVSSGVWAGEIPLERAHALQEVGGGQATMESELRRIGYLGDTPATYRSVPLAAHFELHIEQGPILETERKKIGVVQGVQAYRWYTITVTGRDGHTGTTPFASRADAMLLAARLIAHSHTLATQHPSALASTGIINALPGSVNTIPGTVVFTLDVRAPKDSTVEALEAALKRDFASIAASSSSSSAAAPLTVDWRTDTVSPAVHFHPDCIAAVRSAAARVTPGGSEGLVRDLVSGAGHDSVYTSRRCPTAMIFVPSRHGVSHNPEEYTSPEDCAIGAEVLMHSVLGYDRMKAGVVG
ncbi:hypothetical protein VTK73DRAFT_375 [Phialemonium thermophilum]|uniref:Peptidase M20 dimerisation domain-containing protein n=1 Tax=Phialemonium thermophilum TaxID=223376 RepID=A0ABR3VVG4_9PEZI